QAQDDVSLFNYWQYYSDIENSLYKHFCSVAFEQLESRKTEINKLKTKADWLERQSMVRNKLLEIVGPFPDKTPLNVQVTGVLKKDGFSIEKIIYESIPGYYVTGALYIPDGIKGKAPAIFYACGHSVEGFRVGIYQHIIINLVKKGFVVFTIDPMGQGERYQYWDAKAKKLKFPIPDHEHSYPGAQCLISGYSTGNYFLWDMIRGVDYLLTRKEVDPVRIGVTGRSGGGNLSAYLGAMDDRIAAAAPECYITGYEYIYKSIGPQCAEQNLYGMIGAGLDHADFIEARAPKPTMIIGTTRDFFSVQGTRESYEEAKSMYEVLGAGELLTLVMDDTVHKSTKKNREAMYAFFQKHLNNPGNPEDMEVEIPKPESLQVTSSGQIVESLGGESVFSLNRKIVEKQVSALRDARSNPDKHLKDLPSEVAQLSGFEYPQKFGHAVFSGRYVKSGYILEKYLIPGSGDYMLPIVLLKPKMTT
ncbi:MAG: acetylxylan esterase, partial [Cyclobacteriaceae bacterium]|nr:acetylxylan esterase [Cyclobacteriaceae bacterium]